MMTNKIIMLRKAIFPLVFLFLFLIPVTTGFGSSQEWVEGSGSGETKKEALRAAQIDAIWKILLLKVGGGADEIEGTEDIVKEKLNKDVNQYIAKRRLISMEKDPIEGGFSITAKFLIKKNKVDKLATEMMTTLSGGVNFPSIMFMINDTQLRAAFTQEFLKKGLKIRDRACAIEQYEKAKEEAGKNKEERDRLASLFGEFQANGGEKLTQGDSVELARFVMADYFVKGSHRLTPKEKNNFAQEVVMFNLEGFKIYSSSDDREIANISNYVIAEGDSISEATQVAKKKAAVVLAKEVFELIMKSWKIIQTGG